MDNICDLFDQLAKASLTAPADPAGKGKEVAPEKNQPDLKLSSESKLPSGMVDADLIPAPGYLDGKGKEVAPEKNQPDLKVSSESKLPSGMDELDADIIPVPEDLAGKDPSDVKISSSSNNPTKTGDMEDFDDLDEDSDEDDDSFGSRGYRFEPSPSGGFRLECPTPSGGYFDSMSLEGPNEDGLYVFSLTNTRI